MKECEENLSEEEGFERDGIVGFEKESERLRKMMEFFRYVWVDSRYSVGRIVLHVARILVRRFSACRGNLGEARSWVCLPSNLFFTFSLLFFIFLFFYVFLIITYPILKGLLANSNV